MNHEETIFEQALGITSHQARDEFLQRGCAGDVAMFERLQGLLRAYDRSGKFLEHAPADETGSTRIAKPAAPALATITLPMPTEKAGDHIGRYKLLQQIGEGGCGVVYMAEQEAPVRRRVALKIIKLGMDTRQVIARFEAERQALALMDHPNIAKVLDAGATETGRPFFVMELVRGVKITDYCDEKKLSTEQRLELFIQVCRAVQHAHQKGIIHRDLKPSNILVSFNDGVAVPKIIDFGIAKATSGEPLTDKTVFTAFEQFIGTPAYMSPEQALVTSLDVDTRADIYALGVLLYELLTGRTPFETKELLASGLDEMRRTICEKEPERPSTRLSSIPNEELSTTAQRRGLDAPKLVSQLRGDLDWIVMKCLEKDRARRYETANGLASDLQRHLKNEPVVACPPSNLYRFQKLVRRNRIAVTTGALLIISLVLGLVASTWMFAKERKARQRALVAEETARKKEREAEEASRGFQKSEQEKHRNLYVAEMGLARSAWENGQLERAKALLRAHIPKPGEEDLRGFEWRYLWRLCREDALATLAGHGDYVQCIALSPDGRLLAAGSGDGTITLWDVASRQKTGTLPCVEEPKAVRSLAFSPDGRTLVAAHFSTRLKLWDVATQREIGALEKVALAQKVIRIFPDGKLLACATTDGAVTLWDLKARTLVGQMQGDPTSHPAISVSPDGAILVSSSGDRDILIWDVATQRAIGTLQGHTARVQSVQFSPDGTLLASSGSDGMVGLWDVTRRQRLALLAGHKTVVYSVSFSPDGARLASASIDGLIKLWDVASHTELKTLRGHIAMVNAALFLPDGRMLVSASDDRTVKLWDASSPVDNAILRGLGGPATEFHFLPDGKSIAILAANGSLSFWNPATGHQEAPLTGRFNGFSRSGRLAFGQRATGEIEFWDCVTRRLLATVRGPKGAPEDTAFSADDRFFACADTEGTVCVWEVATGVLAGTSTVPTNSISTNKEGEVQDWVEASGRLLRSPITKLWFPSGTSTLYLGIRRSSDTFLFWDSSSNKMVEGLPSGFRRMRQMLDNKVSLSLVYGARGEVMIESLTRPADEILRLNSMLLLSDRNLLLTGGERDIDLWDLATGHLAASLKGHGGWISSLAMSSDGRMLVSAANDGTLKLWSLGLRKELLGFPADITPWSNVALSADANSVAVLSPTDRLVRVFHAPSLEEIEAEITQISAARKN